MKPEFPIDGVKVGEIAIRGRLDRVDLLPTTRYQLPAVRVIDYKFKKPMSRNEIMGKTKNSDGNYYRQLTFYKLLIEDGTGWHMRDAVLDFLMPDVKGRFKQEVFAPSDQEVSELKNEIIRVTKEIVTMNFAGCHEKDCKYCGLRAMMAS